MPLQLPGKTDTTVESDSTSEALRQIKKQYNILELGSHKNLAQLAEWQAIKLIIKNYLKGKSLWYFLIGTFQEPLFLSW